MQTSLEQINALFPRLRAPADLVSNPVKIVQPVRQAGWTGESTESVLDLLKDNHKKWHIFFNDAGFHNHASHHLLAIYALGANKQLLEAAYATHVAYMKPAFPPPEDKKIETIINDSDWKDHLGDERYYQAYLAFFSAKLLERPDNMASVLEKYVMSKDANINPGKEGKAPMMLSRFMSGLLHPFIHAGYGAEFTLPGIMAEGIAQAALHGAEAVSLLPEELFASGIADITAKLASTVVSSSSEPASPHALSVLGAIAEDDALAPKALGLPVPRDHPQYITDVVMNRAQEKVLKYIDQWTQDLGPDTTAEHLRAKFEEVVWMNTVIYGVGGWAGRAQGQDENKAFAAEFLYMHLVTSAVLAPSLLNILSPSSAALLLRTYFAFSLLIYIGLGRPPLPIADFYASTSAMPSPPASAQQVEAAKNTLPPHVAPNPWTHIVQTTLVHPNEHLCKLQRALLHFAGVYGGALPGDLANASGLKGAEVLDGTLFVRVAGLTADRLGWMREGQAQRNWDRGGFFGDF